MSAMPGPGRRPLLRRVLLTAGAAGLAWWGTGSCASSTTTQPNGAVATITVTPAAETLLAIGDTVRFHAAATASDWTPVKNVTFAWMSGTPTVAQVSPSGVAVAVSNGVAEIEASVGSVVGSAPLTVSQRATGLTVRIAQDTLGTLGDTTRATASPVDAGGTPVAGRTVYWSTSNDTVARVSTDGIVTAVANGTATIAAVVDRYSAATTVTVQQIGARFLPIRLPWSGNAGMTIAPWPILELRDSANHLLAKDSTPVTVRMTYGLGTLSGTLTRPIQGGTVTFDDLAIGGTVGPRVLTFTVPGDLPPIPDTVWISQGVAATLSLVQGDGQTAPAGSMLPDSLAVHVLDAYGNPIPYVIVYWTITAGSGTVGADSSITAGTGVATMSYTLSPTARTDTIQAHVDAYPLAGSPVIFTETAQ